MEQSFTIQIPPVSMNQTGPYDFPIVQRGDFYVQMNQIRLYMRLKVTTDSNSDITEEDGVGVVNLLPNSLFSAIDLEVNGKLMTELQNTHAHYKSYLETILSYSPNSGTGPLQASLFQMDEAANFDDVKRGKEGTVTTAATGTLGQPGYTAAVITGAVADSKNDGFVGRRKQIGKSQLLDFFIPLHSDFLSCERLLPPGMNIVLKLSRAKDSFVLMHPTSTKTFKVVISNLKLHVPYIGIAPSIVAHHRSLGQSGKPSMLPIKKTDITVHHVGSGITNIEIANLFPSRLPKTLILGMVTTTAYNGSTLSNPYNFQNFGVNYISLTKNGNVIPTEPYEPDWDRNLYSREYRSFFDNIGVGTDNHGTLINPKLYKNGCSLFAFDLTPDKCNGFHCHKADVGGTIGLNLKFKAATTDAITVILFSVSDAVVSIFKDDVISVAYV